MALSAALVARVGEPRLRLLRMVYARSAPIRPRAGGVARRVSEGGSVLTFATA